MKKSIWAVCSIGMLSLMTACSSSTTASTAADGTAEGENAVVAETEKSEDQINLQFWNPFTGSDGATMNQIVDDFNKANEGKIHVDVQTMESGDYYAKLPTVVSSGTGIPDVVILHVDRLPYYSQRGLIYEMDEDIASMGLSKDDFIETAWDAGVMEDGKRYSVPLDTHMWELFYNKDILEEIGYSEADLQGITQEKLEEICKAATDKGYTGMGLYWPGICNLYYGLLRQYNGDYVDPSEPAKPLFNSESGIKAAEFIKELQDLGVTNDIGADQETLFKAGTELFCSTGIWANAGFAAIDGLNYGQMFFPEIGGQAGNMANSHNLCMLKQPNDDPARKEASLKFIKYVSDNSLAWAGAGQVPARLEILNSDDFKALPWGFAAENPDAFSFMPACVTSANMNDTVNQYLLEYYNGNYATAKDALDAAAAEAEQAAQATLDTLSK